MWIFPKEKGIKPRYDQKTFDPTQRKNHIQTVASGLKLNGELYIHQDAAISLAHIDKDKSVSYSINKKGNGTYLMVVNGSIEVDGEKLNSRDAIGISETESFEMKASNDSEILLIEVPMN